MIAARRVRRSIRGCLILALALAASPSAAPRGGAGGDVPGRFRQAFRPLRIQTPAALGKELNSSLPAGIVVESGPFDALVSRLLRPLEPTLKARDEVVGLVHSVPTSRASSLLRPAVKALARERKQLAKFIAAVEADYGGVYDRGYLESSEDVRRTRKLAAVLVPFYRSLQIRQDGLRSRLADSLARLREDTSIAWLAAEAAGAPDPLLRAAAAEALSRIGGDTAEAALLRVLADDVDSLLRVRALRGLTAWTVSRIRGAILKALEDPAWEVRALAIRICARANLVAATGPLIVALEKEDGRLRTDIDEALGVLVGVRMHADVALWKRWWAENAEKVAEKAAALEAAKAYEKPVGALDDPDSPEIGETADPKEEPGRATSFYGITTTSKRIVYVVDISRSMNEPASARPTVTGGHANPFSAPKDRTRVSIARWQLNRAVHDLPEDARFNIIVYSESYKLWQPEMVEATARARTTAHRFIDALVANGTTNICDSLDKAFEVAGASPFGAAGRKSDLAADTIFLLTDGVPNRGRVTDTNAYLEEITERNRTTRIVIHGIGIGEAAGSTFLKSLARRNGGRYAGFR